MVDGRTTTGNGRWTDDGACLYYKLTSEPKGSGELKTEPNAPITAADGMVALMELQRLEH